MQNRTSFVCQECGYESPQWLGKCPECGEWNSLKEFKRKNSELRIEKISKESSLRPKLLSEIKFEGKDRVSTGFLEMDGVLGGGIVKGSVILLAGDPGIGKSTLLLQAALNIASDSGFVVRGSRSGDNDNRTMGSVLYISGEESEEQVALRSKRLSLLDKTKKDINLFLLSQTNTDSLVEVIQNTAPSLVIIDSIQTMESENLSGLGGSVGQVRYAASQFIKLAKILNVPIILVGHVTKEGMVAGPMILSHMVDTVLFLEGEKTTSTRILRSFKNRFGPIDEVGIFTMEERGMSEVKNPEQIFLTKSDNNSSGSVLVVTLEGTRAFLVEVQALIVFSKLPIPRRVASGIDYKRLELLLAVLQRHCSLPVESMDVFVNVAGGLKISDPAADLGICLAIYSSFKNIKLSQSVGIAEVGLLGELRSVPLLDKRTKEAKRLGFRNIITSDRFKTLNETLKSLS